MGYQDFMELITVFCRIFFPSPMTSIQRTPKFGESWHLSLHIILWVTFLFRPWLIEDLFQ